MKNGNENDARKAISLYEQIEKLEGDFRDFVICKNQKRNSHQLIEFEISLKIVSRNPHDVGSIIKKETRTIDQFTEGEKEQFEFLFNMFQSHYDKLTLEFKNKLRELGYEPKPLTAVK